MKIELKNTKIFLAMSEETTAFVADVYVDGKKAAYAKNDGHGGCTGYNVYEGKRELLEQAEKHCLSLPKKTYPGLSFSIDMNLENFIDDLLEEELKKKERKKLEKLMPNAILMGVPNGTSCRIAKFKVPLTSISKNQLQIHVDKFKKGLKEGEQILNTNLESLGIKV